MVKEGITCLDEPFCAVRAILSVRVILKPWDQESLFLLQGLFNSKIPVGIQDTHIKPLWSTGKCAMANGPSKCAAFV